jgi:hypothetical protein
MTADTLLDLAHERINALGGWYDKEDAYDRGYHDAIQQALDIIEDVGGKDPLALRAEIAGLRERIRGWTDMIKNCSGVPNNPDSLVRMLQYEMCAAIGLESSDD